MAWSLAAAALLVVGAIAVAHDGDCRLALRNAPIESVVVPPGWAWRELDLAADGWKGAAEWTGGDFRTLSLTLSCVEDPEGLLQRRAEVRAVLVGEELELDIAVGEEAAAWDGNALNRVQLEWRSRDVFGTISGEWNASLGELTLLAQSIDEMLP